MLFRVTNSKDLYYDLQALQTKHFYFSALPSSKLNFCKINLQQIYAEYKNITVLEWYNSFIKIVLDAV